MTSQETATEGAEPQTYSTSGNDPESLTAERYLRTEFLHRLAHDLRGDVRQHQDAIAADIGGG